MTAHHGGKVPLHGRLLAQWLHYVFPQECPYPHLAGSVNPQTPQRWEAAVGEDAATATDEEVDRFLMLESAQRAPSPDAGDSMWTLEEVVLNATTPSDVAGSAWLCSLLWVFAKFGMIVAFALLVLKEMSRVLSVKQHLKGKAAEYNV